MSLRTRSADEATQEPEVAPAPEPEEVNVSVLVMESTLFVSSSLAELSKRTPSV
jgi:hypothetical protein